MSCDSFWHFHVNEWIYNLNKIKPRVFFMTTEFSCRFYCDDHGQFHLPIHIPSRAVCNGISDCYDESDEMGCSTATHFYCRTGKPLYIPIRKVSNRKYSPISCESSFLVVMNYQCLSIILFLGLF